MSQESDDYRGFSARFWLWWLAPAATFALFAVASFLPEERLWGLNHLAFYSPRIRIVVLCVTGFFLVPPLASATWRVFLWALRPFFRGLDDGVNLLALSGVVSFVVFAAFRSSTLLLGDGYLIANEINNAAQRGLGPGGLLEQVAQNERIYPATDFLNFAVSWIGTRLGASPTGGVWIFSCMVGAGFVVWLLAVIRRSGWSDSTKLAVGLFVLFSGAIELFFGYVEQYTPALALGALYILTAARALRGTGRASTPGLILAVGTLFHVQSLLLAPSYVWLVFWVKVFRRNPSRVRPVTFIVVALTIAGALAAGATPAYRRFLLPPLGAGDAYGVFSASHLLDVANQVLLLCPAWLLLSVSAIRGALAPRDQGPQEYDGDAAFGWTVAAPAALFLLLFRPELGMARDWDLYCFTVFGLAVPGLSALARFSTQSPSRQLPEAIIAPAAVLCVAATVSWVGVNADVERSTERYRAILKYDRTNPGYAYETLARHYEDNLQFSRQIAALKEAYETSRNPRLLYKLGKVYNETNDLPAAMQTLLMYITKRPQDDGARKLLLRILAQQNEIDEMIAVSLEGIEYSPQIPDYHFFLGNAYLAKGKTEEGLKEFVACSRLNPPPVMVYEMKRLTDRVQKREPGSDTR